MFGLRMKFTLIDLTKANKYT